MEAGVERFNSPFGSRGRWTFAAWIGMAAAFGLLEASKGTDLQGQLADGLFGAGLWLVIWGIALVMPNREVILGPRTLVVRTWLQALTGRPGQNQWLEGSWVWRSWSGTCAVHPGGPGLGMVSQELLDAFRRHGYDVRDDWVDPRKAHPGRFMLARVLGWAAVVAVLLGGAGFLTTDDLRFLLVQGLGLALGLVAILLYGVSFWLRLPR